MGRSRMRPSNARRKSRLSSRRAGSGASAVTCKSMSPPARSSCTREPNRRTIASGPNTSAAQSRIAAISSGVSLMASNVSRRAAPIKTAR